MIVRSSYTTQGSNYSVHQKIPRRHGNWPSAVDCRKPLRQDADDDLDKDDVDALPQQLRRAGTSASSDEYRRVLLPLLTSLAKQSKLKIHTHESNLEFISDEQLSAIEPEYIWRR